MKKLKLTHFSDSGHSWLSVKRQLLKDLGILGDISGFSYQKGNTVYLEEDRDLSVFLKAYFKGNIPSHWRLEFDIKNSYRERSPIRSYERFKSGELNPVMQAALNQGLILIQYIK